MVKNFAFTPGVKVDDLAMETADVLEYLRKHSVAARKFYIEYGGFLTNHLSHAAVALAGLGASPDQFKRYLEYYAQRLEPTDGPTCEMQSSPRELEDVRQLLGKRKNYFQLLDHYKALLEGEDKYNGDLDSFLAKELPDLLPGLVGSALHPLIHMGYGYSLGDSEMVLEGIAYLHHSYFAPRLRPSLLDHFGRGEEPILSVLERLRQDEELFAFTQTRGKAIENDLGGRPRGFQCCIMASFERAEYIFEKYVAPIKCTSNDPIRWLLDQAITVYACAEGGSDFFLLHGVTSAWSLHKLSKLFQARETISVLAAYFTLALVCAYVVQGRPKIDVDKLLEQETEVPSWPEIKAKTLSLPPDNVDEHVLKLVQVCLDVSEEKEEESNSLFKVAALTALQKPIFFR